MKSSVRMDHRRAHVRFEVMGAMPASLLSKETLQVVNLGASGALVEAALPLPISSEFRMQLVLGSHVSDVTVKVRRVEATAAGSVARYQIGLEFLEISPDAVDAIASIACATEAQA